VPLTSSCIKVDCVRKLIIKNYTSAGGPLNNEECLGARTAEKEKYAVYEMCGLATSGIARSVAV
jgi:hypothetical protein